MKPAMRGNTPKFSWLFLLAIIMGTLFSQGACADKLEWDKKLPIWIYSYNIDLHLGVADKIGKLDNTKTHYIRYVVTFQKGGGEFVAERIYDFNNPGNNNVTYPDDFHFIKAPGVRAVGLYGNVSWRIYIDGVLNASGTAETKIQSSTVNGQLTNVKGK